MSLAHRHRDFHTGPEIHFFKDSGHVSGDKSAIEKIPPSFHEVKFKLEYTQNVFER